MKNENESPLVMSSSLGPHGLYSSWNSPGQNTGVSSCSLLQGIFPTQVSNPGLPHCRQILYYLTHQGSPRILEWVDYPLSSGSSQLRNRTEISCFAGQFFISWAIGEPLLIERWLLYSIVLVSAKHQHESAIGIPMSPPFSSLPPSSPSHPSRLLQSPHWSSLSHTANFHWLSILHTVTYVSMLHSPYILPSPLGEYFWSTIYWTHSVEPADRKSWLCVCACVPCI